MEAKVISMGDPAISSAIKDGLEAGRSRAEMRQEIERLKQENAALRRKWREAQERWEGERNARVNADIECRAKSRALMELRRGQSGAWAQLLEANSDKRRKQERFVTVVSGLVALGAVALVLMAILVFVGA